MKRLILIASLLILFFYLSSASITVHTIYGDETIELNNSKHKYCDG